MKVILNELTRLCRRTGIYRWPGNYRKQEAHPCLEDGSEFTRVNRMQWLIEVLVILGVIAWVVAALATQNFFLLSGTPLLGKELAYAFRRMIDRYFSTGSDRTGLPCGQKYCSCSIETKHPQHASVPTR